MVNEQMSKATFEPMFLLEHRRGEVVEILGRAESAFDDRHRIWIVRFEDGFQPSVWDDELTPLEGSSREDWPQKIFSEY